MPLGRFNSRLYVRDGKLVRDNIDCCCGGEVCQPPTGWIIGDYTDGGVVTLASGAVTPFQPRPPDGAATGGTIENLPPIWRTRSTHRDIDGSDLHFGLFLVCPVSGTELVEGWTVTPKKCGGGSWWVDHEFSGSYTDPCCLEEYSVAAGENPPLVVATVFNGNEDGEWTNMRNWTAPGGGSQDDLDLPGPDDPVTVAGVLSSYAGGFGDNVSVGTLTVEGSGEVRIKMLVADEATISGRIAGEGENVMCPGEYGQIFCEGIVTFDGSGSNHGQIRGEQILFTDASTNTGLVESDLIKYEDDSTADGAEHRPSAGSASGGGVCDFRDNAVATGANIFLMPVRFNNDSAHNGTSVYPNESGWKFYDNSENNGEVQSSTTVRFYDRSSNGPTGIVRAFEASFQQNATNYGEVFAFECEFDGAGAANITGPGPGNVDIIAVGGGVGPGDCSNATARFTNGAANAGTVNRASFMESTNANASDSTRYSVSGTVTEFGCFRGSANRGVVGGTARFISYGSNADVGVCEGDAFFSYTSSNYGECEGDALFSYSSTNHGVCETGTFEDSSNAFSGVVRVLATFSSGSNNQGSVGTAATSGSGVFNADSTNNGTVYGDATFNDDSSNFGTVTGTTTCNTTGTCP